MTNTTTIITQDSEGCEHMDLSMSVCVFLGSSSENPQTQLLFLTVTLPPVTLKQTPCSILSHLLVNFLYYETRWLPVGGAPWKGSPWSWTPLWNDPLKLSAAEPREWARALGQLWKGIRWPWPPTPPHSFLLFLPLQLLQSQSTLFHKIRKDPRLRVNQCHLFLVRWKIRVRLLLLEHRAQEQGKNIF